VLDALRVTADLISFGSRGISFPFSFPRPICLFEDVFAIGSPGNFGCMHGGPTSFIIWAIMQGRTLEIGEPVHVRDFFFNGPRDFVGRSQKPAGIAVGRFSDV
jgi:hypothetical protein